jgi:penicillin amidase
MLKRTLLSLILLLTLSIFWLYNKVDSALPLLNGKATVFSLQSTTIIDRDSQGIPTIKAKNRHDVAIATGFIHAQERFFQMDLLRRKSAGELARLFGAPALNYDQSIRLHRFRERAKTIIDKLPDSQRLLLKAYTRGVNQGLKSLGAKPFEYLLLQQEPTHWREEDSILTIFSMYVDLQYHDGQRERSLGLMKAIFSADVYAFLNPKGSIWDAAIDNSQFQPSPVPKKAWPAASSTLTDSKPTAVSANIDNVKYKYQDDEFPGSNSWAISGRISSTGSAIIANDMHLGIRVPNTWFRASFEYRANNIPVKVTGATLPGTPNIVVGSNGHIAWGFTNSYGDYSDIIILNTIDNTEQYLTPTGAKDFKYHKQHIAVKGEQTREITIKETIWGPVIGENHEGKLLVYRWVAHDKQAVNIKATELELAQTVKQAFFIAAQSGIPAQNMVIGDKEGTIGWTIMGPIPEKTGDVGETPTYWDNDKNNWRGYLTPDKYPTVINPQNNRLWTANSRVIGGDMLSKIGNGGYALGARAQQIRDNLNSLKAFNEKALLDIGLDDRALFLTRWKNFLLTKVLHQADLNKHKGFNQVRELLLRDDKLSASIDSTAYRLVRNFRLNTRNLVFSELNNSFKNIDDGYNFRSIRHQIETPLWQMINQQPENFLMRPSQSWSALFNEALQQTINDMTKDGANKQQTLVDATWGQQNTSAIKHPLSDAIPFLSMWLDMPSKPLSGDSYMPKVQGTSFGASQRMVVSPGHEETGIFNMPTSQAGHPWSPYYGKGHSDWEKGSASPFLPGKTKYTLTLLKGELQNQ